MSDLGGLPGVGWFVPLCPLSTLWAITSVCVSAMSASGGVGGMPVLSGFSRVGLGIRTCRALLAYTAIGAIAAIGAYRARWAYGAIGAGWAYRAGWTIRPYRAWALVSVIRNRTGRAYRGIVVQSPLSAHIGHASPWLSRGR